MLLPVSLFRDEKDNEPQLHELPWAEFCAAPIESTSKAGVVCWSPAHFEATRAKAGVKSVSCLVFDLDSDLTDSLIHSLTPFDYIVHSTFTPGRWRIILRTSRPHTAKEHPLLWRAASARLGGGFDEACTDSSRLYYWPTKHPDREFFKYENSEGLPVDVDDLLCAVPFSVRPTLPVRPPNKPAPMFTPPVPNKLNLESKPIPLTAPVEIDLDVYRKQVRESHIKPERKTLALAMLSLKWGPETGQRDQDILAAVGGLFTVCTPIPSQDLCEYLCEHVLANMVVEPEGRDEWHRVFMDKCERQRPYRNKLDADRGIMDAIVEKTHTDRGETPDWRKQFQGKSDENGVVTPRPSGPNVELILRNDARFKSLRYNVVTGAVECEEAPLAGKSMNVIDVSLANWLSREYKFTVPRHEVLAQLSHVVAERHYDPVKEYLEGLVWDRVPRVSKLLRDKCSAIGSDFYVDGISRKWFIAAARRGLEPGIQMDNILILKGKGGVGKTSFVRALGGHFAAQTTLDLSNKDALQIVSGKWMIELAELSSWRRSEASHFRAFVTQTEDTFRPPYGRVAETFKRRCIFVGTSNEVEPVDDVDGARRYWTVEVGNIDLPWLRENRDQLWAEAVHLAKTEELHYFTQEEQELIKPEVALHQKSEPLADQIEDWFLKQKRDKRPMEINTIYIMDSMGFSTSDKLNRGLQAQVGKALRALGFMHKRKATGRRAWYYETPKELLDGTQTRSGAVLTVVKDENETN